MKIVSITTISFLILSLTSCLGVKKMTVGGNQYRSYFPKEKLAQLKEEVPLLYKFLKKGELLECLDCGEKGTQYLYSLRLAKFLKQNYKTICNSQFLSNLDNFLLVFGGKGTIIEEWNKTTTFFPNAMICNPESDRDHSSMQGWSFDENGKLLGCE